MTQYIAIINVPGYLPEGDDGDVPIFDSAEAAWDYLAEEREHHCDQSDCTCLVSHAVACARHLRPPLVQDLPGVVYLPTPGYNGDHDLGLAYSVIKEPDGQ